MHVFVLGANGLLGSTVVSDAIGRNYRVTGTYHTTEPALDAPMHELDIRDTAEFEALIDRTDADVVINCAAFTDVDGCEDHPERASSINGRAPGELAQSCETREISFAHVSTDYVFDGRTDFPYDESAETNPIQMYGRSKLEGESAVRERHSAPLLVRLSFVYGVRRSTGALTGFPAWVRERFRTGQETPLFTDQHVTPSRAGQAAETMLDLLSRETTGTYHVASRTCTTPYEFGLELAREMGSDETMVREGSRSDIDRSARRPADTCLNVERVSATLGRPQPTIKDDIDAIGERI